MPRAATVESVILFWSEEFQELSIAASHAHAPADCALSAGATVGSRADWCDAKTASIVAFDMTAGAAVAGASLATDTEAALAGVPTRECVVKGAATANTCRTLSPAVVVADVATFTGASAGLANAANIAGERVERTDAVTGASAEAMVATIGGEQGNG